jgi:hypothetical protein
VWIDPTTWPQVKTVADRFAPNVLKDDNGRPAPAIKLEELAGKDSELIATEVECRRAGIEGIFVELDIPDRG